MSPFFEPLKSDKLRGFLRFYTKFIYFENGVKKAPFFTPKPFYFKNGVKPLRKSIKQTVPLTRHRLFVLHFSIDQ